MPIRLNIEDIRLQQKQCTINFAEGGHLSLSASSIDQIRICPADQDQHVTLGTKQPTVHLHHQVRHAISCRAIDHQ